MKEVHHIPTDLNPANLATKFETGRTLPTGFQYAYKEIGDGTPFRAGPSFMKQGLQAAITDKIITNITSMKITLENKRIARIQLINPDDEDNNGPE